MQKKPILFDKMIFCLILLICVLEIIMYAIGARETLDLKLYYTGDQARFLIDGLDLHEKNIYFINELFDVLLLMSYSALFYTGYKKMFPDLRAARFVALAPGFCDVIETFFILYALRAEGPHQFFDWLGVATFLKWVGFAVVAIYLLRHTLISTRRLLRRP